MFPRSVVHIIITCCAVHMLLLTGPSIAPAQDTTPDVFNWVYPQDYWWHLAAAWDRAAVPDADSIVYIGNPDDKAFQAYVSHNAAAAEVNLDGGSKAEALTYLTVYNSSTLTVLNDLNVNNRAILFIKDGDVTARSVTINPGGAIAHRNGVLTIDGGQFNPLGDHYFLDGSNGGLGSVVVKNGATWDVPQWAYVGYNDAGTLTIESGAQLTSTYARIGFQATGEGEVTVDGNGSAWINPGSLEVATNNHGEMTIRNYGHVENGLGAVGTGTGSVGMVTVTDHGIWTNTSTLHVGGRTAAGGQGTLIVEDGGSVTAASGVKVWPDGEVHLLSGGVLEATGGNVTLTGGRLLGNSELIIPADAWLENDGVVDPQRVLRVVGGDYLQQAGGRLEIDLGGPDPELHDQLLINDGSATLGGTLVVSLSNGFVPDPGQRFDIVWAGDGVEGAFADVLLPTLPGGLSLDVRPVPSGLALVAVVPEPAGLWLLLAGLAGVLRARRTKFLGLHSCNVRSAQTSHGDTSTFRGIRRSAGSLGRGPGAPKSLVRIVRQATATR